MGMAEYGPSLGGSGIQVLEIKLPRGSGSGFLAAASRGASRSPSAENFALAETNTARLSTLAPLIAPRL